MSSYLWVIRKRLPIILLTVASALLIAYLVVDRSTRQYTATTQLLVTPFGIERPDNASNLYLQQVTNTLSAMLRGPTVTSSAKERLGLLDNEALPEFSLTAIPNSALLALSVTAGTAGPAQETANILANTLVATVRSRYNVNVRNIGQTLEQQLERTDRETQVLVQARLQAVENGAGDARLAELERRISANRAAYGNLVEQRNQAQVAAATQANVVSVYQAATVRSVDLRSRLPLVLVAGALAGALGGLALAFLLEGIRPRLYTRSQAEAFGNVTAVLPPGRYAAAQVVEGRRNKRLVEALRRLRAGLVGRLGGTDHAVVLVTGPQAWDAHPFVANNLAVGFARSRAKTLLIDTNMDAPTAQRALGVADGLGLADAIAQKMPAQQVIQESTSGVHVITTGTEAFATPDLVGSRTFQNLIDEVKGNYDYVVISSTPVATSADTAVLTRFADRVLLVLGSNTPEAAATEALKEISGVPVEIVLNGWG